MLLACSACLNFPCDRKLLEKLRAFLSTALIFEAGWSDLDINELFLIDSNESMA